MPPAPAATAALAVLLLAGACCAVARAEGPSGEDAARDLAEEVMERARGAGADSFRAWSRGVVERALEHAGEAAADAPGRADAKPPSPLAAERHAGRIAGLRPSTAEVLVFMSLSVPSPSWRAWAREAALAGAPLVLRGVAAEGIRATVAAVGDRLGPARAGVAIDPRLFRLFGIERVPAVAVVPGGVAPCRSRGCAEDSAPPHDIVFGNTGLAAALAAIAKEGVHARGVAGRRLELLRGEP